MKTCVYGGQFGSEGKGCLAAWLIDRDHRRDSGIPLIVAGENSPNSGHTDPEGRKTRALPVSSWRADVVVLGPDAAVDPALLITEVSAIRKERPRLKVVVHAHAALIDGMAAAEERADGLDRRIGSTVTGGGMARCHRNLHRAPELTVGHVQLDLEMEGVEVLDRAEYLSFVHGHLRHSDWLFECSQGLMLDVTLGYYPFVTSRNTHPRVALARNGMTMAGTGEWELWGCYRTFPIRTGGNSGPTGGRELTWAEVGVTPEVATVTKRTRRVFEFSRADFLQSLAWVNPDGIGFTHLDYLAPQFQSEEGFAQWLRLRAGWQDEFPLLNVAASREPGRFAEIDLDPVTP